MLIERFIKKVIVYNDKIVLELKALGDLYINNDLNPAKAGENDTIAPTPTHIGTPLEIYHSWYESVSYFLFYAKMVYWY